MAWEMEGSDIVGKGRLLPEGWYRATVEVAVAEEKENGTSVKLQYGDLLTPEGAVEFLLADGTEFRIGNRKLFQRGWWEHTNVQAQSIGHRELARLMIAAGLAQKPAKGEKFVSPFEKAEELALALEGKQVQVRVRHKNRVRKLADGTKVQEQDEDGEPRVDAEVVDTRSLS